MADNVDEVLEKLTGAVANTTEVMTRMIATNEEHSRIYKIHAEVADNFREEIRALKRSLEKIVHVLHEGNGEKPLITRVALLETNHQHLRETYFGQMEELKEEIRTDAIRLAEEKSNQRITVISGKFGIKAALIGGGAALLVAILTAILERIM